MDLNFTSRDYFTICGYCVETSLEKCTEDLSRLWSDFEYNKHKLYSLFGCQEDFYGLMWKTGEGRFCYLIGIEAQKIANLYEEVCLKKIPQAYYAVATVPASISAFEAWTEYYEKVLPEAGYVPAPGHEFDFEYYTGDGSGNYELWTPVVKTL